MQLQKQTENKVWGIVCMAKGHTSDIHVISTTGLISWKVFVTGALTRACKSCDDWSTEDPDTAV